ncbi:MFS domain-containing protein [Fusarium keratoplasticum]|nr:MFS domain-containing protein [Fusarium keratoplasticum]
MDPTFPNGGYGWVCTAASAMINAHTWGLNSSYGAFLAHYLSVEYFTGATPLEYGFIGSLSISCALMVPPVATALTRGIGARPTMLCGVVIHTAGLILASLAAKVLHLFLTQGILFGLGMGLLFSPAAAIVPQWFSTHRSLATSISASGSGLGVLIYSVASGAMIQKLGVPWTLHVLGIVAFVVKTLCACLVKDRSSAIGSTHLAFDTRLLRRSEFLLLLGFSWFSMLAYVILVFSLSNYATWIGLDPSKAALISALFNLEHGFGRPVIGYFSDQTGRLNMSILMTLLAALISLAVWIPARTYPVLVFFSVACGPVAGTFWATIGAVKAEVAGIQQVPTALNLVWLSIALPSLFSEPIALQIVSGTGSYLGTQLFTGFMFFAVVACLLVVRGWKVNTPADTSREFGEPVQEECLDEQSIHIGVAVNQAKFDAEAAILSCLRWEKV